MTGRTRVATAALPLALALAVALVSALALPPPAFPAPGARAADKDLIAVLDLQGVVANEAETYALTDRLREELLRSGSFILVDRSQMEAVLNEQALQQTGCTEQDCAVQVGRILGVRRIVTGKVIKINEEVWLVSGLMVDVESAQTLRAESVQHRGDFFALMSGGMAELARKLAAPAAAPVAPGAPATAAHGGPFTVRVTFEQLGLYVGSNSFVAFVDDIEIPERAQGLLYRGELASGEHTFKLRTKVLGNEKEHSAVFYSEAGKAVEIKITRWAAGVAGGYNVHLNGALLFTRLF